MQRASGYFMSVLGIARHMGKWLVSSSGDLFFPNPSFKPRDEESDQESDEESDQESDQESKDNFDEPYTRVKVKKGVAVYCVHGTADRVNAFSLLAERSVNLIPEEISGFHLLSFDKRCQGCSIKIFADQLGKKILINGDSEVVLAGHSRGGLVAAYFTEYLAAMYGIKVHAVVTMASPFGGSYLALPPLSWFSESVKEMQPGSELLADLQKKMCQSDCKYFYFAAKNDWIVQHGATHVPGAGILRTLDTAHHGHLTMMSSHQLVREFNACLCRVITPSDEATEEYSDEGEADEEREIAPFHVVPVPTPLQSACEKLSQEIKNLQHRFHWFSANSKNNVLQTLYDRLFAMITDGRDEAYPEAQTIAEYVSAFLQDEKVGGGKKPADILSTSLNNPFGFTFYGEARSQNFINNFICSLQDEPLPMQPEKCPELIDNRNFGRS